MNTVRYAKVKVAIPEKTKAQELAKTRITHNRGQLIVIHPCLVSRFSYMVRREKQYATTEIPMRLRNVERICKSLFGKMTVGLISGCWVKGENDG